MNAKRYFKYLSIDINATRYHKPLHIPHSTPEGIVLSHNFSHDCWSPYDLRLCAVSRTLGAWSVTWHHSAGTPGAAYPPLSNLWYKINISSNSWYVENISSLCRKTLFLWSCPQIQEGQGFCFALYMYSHLLYPCFFLKKIICELHMLIFHTDIYSRVTAP